MAKGLKVKSRRKSYGRRRPKPPDGIFGADGRWIHGCYQTAEYRSYVNAKTLCRNPKNPHWRYYGGRGIEFRLSSFAVFLEHLGRRPAGKILDRIDRDGHFEIGNVYWRRKRRKSATNRKAQRKARATICGHPKHHAKGLCRACYEATPEVRARRAAYHVAHYVPTPRKITGRVNSCGHPDRPHYAFGLCVACYRVSPQGRAVKRRYAASPKGKKSRARYAASPENRARQKAPAVARYVPKPDAMLSNAEEISDTPQAALDVTKSTRLGSARVGY